MLLRDNQTEEKYFESISMTSGFSIRMAKASLKFRGARFLAMCVAAVVWLVFSPWHGVGAAAA